MSVDTNITTQTERAYHALYNGAVVVNRSDRLRMLFTGDKAVDSLTGLVTNDVAALKVGQGQYAAALTNKGKVLADVRIFSTAGGLLGSEWNGGLNRRLALLSRADPQRGFEVEDEHLAVADLARAGRADA